MAHEEGFVSSKHAIVRNFQIRKRACAWHGADFFRDVFAGVYGNHARRLQSIAGINAIDARVSVQRAHEDDMQRLRQPDVIDIMCESLDQSWVFGALDSLSDVLTHDASGAPASLRAVRAHLARSLSTSFLCRVLHGFHDMLITGATAQISFQSRSEEHTSELQSRLHLVCRLLLEKKKKVNEGGGGIDRVLCGG